MALALILHNNLSLWVFLEHRYRRLNAKRSYASRASDPWNGFISMVDVGSEVDLLRPSPETAAEATDGARVTLSKTKRVLDISIALLALVFLLPLLVAAAICIVLDSRGPVFFLQRRTGLAGQPIRIFKLRTMTVIEDGDDVRHAVPVDDRVTRVGRFLRRSSIDELPQLINVIKGRHVPGWAKTTRRGPRSLLWRLGVPI